MKQGKKRKEEKKRSVTFTLEHRKGRDMERLVYRCLLPIPFRSTTVTSGRIIMAITPIAELMQASAIKALRFFVYSICCRLERLL